MSNINFNINQSDYLLNAAEVAKILNCSKPQVFLMMRRGDFPVVRMGKLVRVRKSVIEQYIENQTSPSHKF